MDGNKAFIQEYFNALSGHDKTAEVVGRYVADAALAQHIADAERAFPGYQLIPQQVIGEGDMVAVRAQFHGVQRGAFAGVDATGKEVSAGMMIIYQIANRKIVNHWMQLDMLSLLQQLQEVQAANT